MEAQGPAPPKDRTLLWVVVALVVMAVVAVGIWLAVKYSKNGSSQTSTNVSNLTAIVTCAGSNAGAVASWADSIGGLGFMGTVTCPSGYTALPFKGNTICGPPETTTVVSDPSQLSTDLAKILPGPAAVAGLNACFPGMIHTGPGRHLGAIDPPCPSSYTLVTTNGQPFCNPPNAPCPAGFTVNPINPRFCVPPEAVGGACATGTLRNGTVNNPNKQWCVPT